MGLKAVLENLEGVDDAVRGLYKEIDKRWVLDLDGVDAHPSVRALSGALDEKKARNADLTTKVAEFEAKLKEYPEDFDPEKWIEYKAAAADREKDRTKKDEQVQNLTQLHNSRLEAQKTKYEAELAAKDAKAEDLENRIDGIMRDQELTDLLIESHVSDGLMAAARQWVGSKVKTERLDGGVRRNVVETNIGPLPLKDWISTWAESDEGKPFISKPTGPAAQGGRHGAPSDKNPWAKDTLNLTEQGRILTHDRDKARRMMGEAGWTQQQIASRLGA